MQYPKYPDSDVPAKYHQIRFSDSGATAIMMSVFDMVVVRRGVLQFNEPLNNPDSKIWAFTGVCGPNNSVIYIITNGIRYYRVSSTIRPADSRATTVTYSTPGSILYQRAAHNWRHRLSGTTWRVIQPRRTLHCSIRDEIDKIVATHIEKESR